MPIDRRLLQLRSDSEVEALMRKIVAFLEERQDEAFTFSELALAHLPSPPPRALELHELRDAPLPLDHRRFLCALDGLVEFGVVEERGVQGGIYYALGRTPLEAVLDSGGDP